MLNFWLKIQPHCRDTYTSLLSKFSVRRNLNVNLAIQLKVFYFTSKEIKIYSS